MKTRQLGKSSLQVTELGFGCMSLPTNVTDAHEILDSAYEGGIRYFDTADLYDKGKNEEIVGSWLQGKRKEIILSTKVGNVWNKDGETWHFDSSPQHIREGVFKSLTRLKTDYIDLYQLHGGTMEDNLEEVVHTMEALKKEGVILEYGISSIRPNVIKRFITDSSAVSVMMQLSLKDRRPEEWLPLLAKEEVNVIARGPLSKGELTASPELYASAFRYILSFPEVSTALVGASHVKQIEESLKAYSTPINDHVFQSILAQYPLDTYEEHRE
ncbi:aldo/keto reductase [Paenisporosarcina cavernae]|uniref:Aldo/keto reductase n=1 Tax=Paenisporosarcina cavernae TaxID=2320858 RepID=A0A385YUI0_9BACL|nr:aldo/keto reductase [Paenisporosarcina cavernae]AYC29338.1 aldo/keto reductase [Paenisporosarcina cavernae]